MLYRTHRRYTLQTALTIHAPLDPSRYTPRTLVRTALTIHAPSYPSPIHSADSGTDGAYYTCSIGPIADTLCRRRLLYMLAWTRRRWTLRTLVRTALTIHARLDPLPINSADSGTDGAYYTKLAYVCILIVQYSVYIHIRDAPMYHRNIYIVYIVYCIQFKKNVIWCF